MTDLHEPSIFLRARSLKLPVACNSQLYTKFNFFNIKIIAISFIQKKVYNEKKKEKKKKKCK